MTGGMGSDVILRSNNSSPPMSALMPVDYASASTMRMSRSAALPNTFNAA